MTSLTHRGRLEKAVAAAEANYRSRTRPQDRYQAPTTRTERRIRAELAAAVNAARRALWLAQYASKAA
jgi:hypothetical protein